jgi:hypothetical protein
MSCKLTITTTKKGSLQYASVLFHELFGIKALSHIEKVISLSNV